MDKHLDTKNKIKNYYYNIFSWACFAFYFGYGIICTLIYKPYCRYIMFPKWDHDDDKVMEYFVFGAGECCVVMAILVLLLKDGVDNHKKSQNIIFQVYCWIMWTCTELYYGLTGVEYPIISTIHVILCIIVLYLAIKSYQQF